MYSACCVTGSALWVNGRTPDNFIPNSTSSAQITRIGLNQQTSNGWFEGYGFTHGKLQSIPLILTTRTFNFASFSASFGTSARSPDGDTCHVIVLKQTDVQKYHLTKTSESPTLWQSAVGLLRHFIPFEHRTKGCVCPIARNDWPQWQNSSKYEFHMFYQSTDRQQQHMYGDGDLHATPET